MSSLYSTGSNSTGQLGLNDITNRNEFTQIGTVTTWSSFSCGGNHAAAIKSDGTLWVTGYNNHGQLGLNDEVNRDEFTQIGELTTWNSVVCGFYTTLAIKTDGTLWSTGFNIDGQLGLGDNTSRKVFTQVGTGTTWSFIAGANSMTLAIKTNGTLWATGENTSGGLGLGDNIDRNIFTQVGSSTWSLVACGGSFTLAIKTNGTLWSTGANGYGELGLGDTTNRNEFTQIGSATVWSAIAGGNSHSLAIKTDGTLWGAGLNWNGQLGLGDLGYGYGNTPIYTITQIGSGITWSLVAGGYQQSSVVQTDGTAWTTGSNSSGELGLGDNTERKIFTQVGSSVTWEIPRAMSQFTYLSNAPTIGKHRGIMGINGGVLFDQKTIIGDEIGKLYALNMDTYTDAGNLITRVRRTQIINKERVNVIHNKVEVEFEPGVGLDVAEGVSGEDPQASLRWSNDDGNTWSTPILTDIGEYQRYGTRAIWRRLGKSRNRIYELTVMSPVKFVLIGTYGDLKACKF